jgi:hypothetical protein
MTVNLLDWSLSSVPVPSYVQRAIICKMFGLSPGEVDRQLKGGRHETYFTEWYEDQCERSAGQISSSTHGEIIEIIHLLQAENASKESIKDKLRERYVGATRIPEEKPLDGSINLAARLWLMLSIGELENCLTPGPTIHWDEGCLNDAIKTELSPTIPNTFNRTDDTTLPKSFNALNLERIGGIRICWTSNLAEHLIMKDDDTRVLIFHQASFLRFHRDANR